MGHVKLAEKQPRWDTQGLQVPLEASPESGEATSRPHWQLLGANVPSNKP